MATTTALPTTTSKLRKAVFALIVAGAIAQLLMSAYYLGMAHAPHPRSLPVGYVASDQNAAQAKSAIEQGRQFSARQFGSSGAMTEAIRAKKVFGGVDLTSQPPRLYVASAAGTAASTAMRTAFTAAIQKQVGRQVEQLVSAGKPVPPTVVQQLTAPAAVTDVVPLPPDDRTGASLGLLVQALSLGATVASMGLGRIGKRTSASLRRGVGHVGAMLAYAGVSACAVLATAHAFGVAPAHASGRLFWTFLLLSIAITASVAGLVALIGPAGSFLGTAYFLFGVPIAGASILPEFLPTAGRVLGQSLPTGAGTTLIRDSLYFPSAAVTGPVAVLAIYAVAGVALVLTTNAVANPTLRTSLLAPVSLED